MLSWCLLLTLRMLLMLCLSELLRLIMVSMDSVVWIVSGVLGSRRRWLRPGVQVGL